MYHLYLSLFHVVVVVPFLLYIALNKADTNSYVYKFIFVLGLFLIAFHGYKTYMRYMSGSSSMWINMIHFFYIGPLLAYIGYHGKDTPRSAYELLALLAFAALGYHTYHLILMVNMDTKLL